MDGLLEEALRIFGGGSLGSLGNTISAGGLDLPDTRPAAVNPLVIGEPFQAHGQIFGWHGVDGRLIALLKTNVRTRVAAP